ncbi:unnamed protein product [Acanthoscelides obtectus]|uniref:Uncharacterized protein n=1 Tax=Acanthoscelides obtectus TaxID=200917 RepID=A0A9P0QG88_ACAOB|nr:unnamed protein product [Acanthoscelides obtectus]CAK1687625.1 hypothetical protein AOBTE_LOCUS36301 [Acanthoscelides obtectus]
MFALTTQALCGVSNARNLVIHPRNVLIPKCVLVVNPITQESRAMNIRNVSTVKDSMLLILENVRG